MTTKRKRRPNGTPANPVIKMMPETWTDEDAAVEFIEDQRWGDNPRCAYCESDDVYQIKDRKTGERNKRYIWKCSSCKKNVHGARRDGLRGEPNPLAALVPCVIGDEIYCNILELTQNRTINS